MSTATACTGAEVTVSDGVNVKVGDGVSVSVGTRMGVVVKVPAVGVSVRTVGKVGINKINGVAVTTPGVRDGIGVHTGNGWGGTPQVSQAERMNAKSKMQVIFFMKRLYLCIICRPWRRPPGQVCELLFLVFGGDTCAVRQCGEQSSYQRWIASGEEQDRPRKDIILCG